MAITSAWTHNIPSAQLPTGASTPTVTNPVVASGKEHYTLVLTPDSTYDNATPATAFAAIGDAVKAYFDASQDTAVLGLDAAATINARITITYIERKFSTFTYKDYPNQYQVAVGVFYVEYFVEWAVA